MADLVVIRRLFLLIILWAGPGCLGQRGESEFLALLTGLRTVGGPCWGRQDSGLVVVTWE